MAVAKKCDRCGKYYEGLPENQFRYEEDGNEYTVNSFRIGNWNARTKQWDSIISAYDLCKDCAKEITQLICETGELRTRVPKIPEKFQKNKEENNASNGSV